MTRIRPLKRDDLPAIAALHGKTFGNAATNGEASSHAYLAHILCDHPWADPELPSLVCEGADGSLVGCLGIMPRPMEMNGEPIRVAVFHNFMVDPAQRGSLAALQLVKRALGGPQALSLADGNTASRRIWETMGGEVVLTYSLRWLRAIRPLRSASRMLARAQSLLPLELALRPICGLVDAVATRLPRSPFHVSSNGRPGIELEAEDLLERLPAISWRRRLRPSYDLPSITWLLDTLRDWKRDVMLRKVMVAGDNGSNVGWYLYYARRGGVGEVLQIGARRGAADAVLEHLFHDAWSRGVVALSGRLEPSLVPALATNRCLFDNAGFWLLAHSRRLEILDALHRGDAFLSRLESESWIRLAY